MTSTSPGIDPLTVLPPEVVLRVLESASISALASLTAASKAWHTFIDVIHQDAIYSSESKTAQPPGGTRDFSYLSDNTSFSKVFENPKSWKDVCKRQTLLSRNWADERPVTRESVLQVGNDPVWRFKPDFKRRLFLSTSQAGGLNVTDMDSGRIIWRLPSTLSADDEAVRPFAHLEYQDGMAVFDREGDAVEVWQTDLEGTERGEFRRIAILEHNCQTRGFQLSYSTLCVVSSEGQGFVYDMTERPPKLKTHLDIEHGGVGHLDQSSDAVVYSMGFKGYHVHDKESGAFLGALHPSHCTEKYHILAPTGDYSSTPSHRAFAFGPPSRDCLTPIKVEKGGLTPPEDPDHVWHGEDEWGSGMLNGNLFVAFARSGRVFVCSNWREALHDQASLAAHSAIIECESDGGTFDLGGWLSVRNHRLMFEIRDRIYIVALDDDNKIQDVENPARASYSLPTSSTSRLAVPVSFMGLYDDAIMTTYATLGWHQPLGGIHQHQGPSRIIPTKTIRIVSLAPDLSTPSASTSGNNAPEERSPEEASAESGVLPDPNQFLPPAHNLMSRQATLLHLLAMLREDAEGDEEGEDDMGVTTIDLNDLQNLHDLHDHMLEWDDLEEPEDEFGEHQHGHEHEHEGL